MSHHINASKEDVAKIVFMAGDPLRVKKFVEDYLEDYKLVNSVRNELGYTGFYKGKRVSVFSHGMGLDSIGIYAHELYNDYDVDIIIRFGSAGAYVESLNLLDVLIVKEAYTESNYGLVYNETTQNVLASDSLYKLAIKAKANVADNASIKEEVKIHSSMWFYTNDKIDAHEMASKGMQAVEMEAYALYSIAKYFNKQALTLLTISDHLISGEHLHSMERQTKFITMFELLLQILLLV